ncbi:MAG: YunC family protein [Fibrobacterota bacterium]
MEKTKVTIENAEAQGYVVSLGKINLVFVKTRSSLLACGAFDVQALDAFDCPAARVKSKGGGVIVSVDELLCGEVVEVNNSARKHRLREGMSGRDALRKFLEAENTDWCV